MIWLVLYIVLLVVYLLATVYHLAYVSFSYPLLVATAAGSLPIFRLVIQDLAKHNLPLYFWLERAKLRLNSDTTGKWWFQARYDGISSRNIFEKLESELKSPKFKIRMVRQTSREKEFEIDDTLFVTASYSSGEPHSGDNEESYIDVTSKTIEVSYGHAKKKLETQIEPFLILLDNAIKPKHHSFELNVEFLEKRNPFFNVYVANLSQSQIEDFKVVLHVDGNGPRNLKDKVVISSNKLRVTAESTNSFKKLAKDFILLTPDTRILIGEKNG